MKFKRIAAAAAAVACAASMTSIAAFADDNVAGVAGVAGEAAPVATTVATTTAATEEETTVATTTAAPETEAPVEEEEILEEEELLEDDAEAADDAVLEDEAEAEAEEEEYFDESDPLANLTFQDLLTVEDPSEFGMTDDEFGVFALSKLCDEYGIFLGAGTSSNWGQAVKLLTYNNSEDEPGDDYFDSSLLNENSMVLVFYESETAPEFILQSWSGGEGWAKVPANEEASVPGLAVFTYDYMAAMYQSEDFSTVDAIYVGDTGSDLVVTGAYLINADVLLNALGISMDDLDFEAEDFDLDFEEDDAPAETEAPVEVVAVAPSADGDVPSANTGNMSAAAIAGIMAAAGAAAFALRKRK